MNKAGYLLPRYVCFTDAETNANQTWGAPQWRSKQDAVGTQREEHGFQLKGVEANELARNVFYIDFYLSCLLKWNQPTIANLTSLWSFTWTSVGGSVTGKPLSLYCISRTLLDSCICSRFLPWCLFDERLAKFQWACFPHSRSDLLRAMTQMKGNCDCINFEYPEAFVWESSLA